MGNFGIASKGIEIAFPITPHLILILKDLEIFSNEIHNHNHFHFILNEENIIYYNSLQVLQSYRNVFNKDDNFELAKEIVNNKPYLKDSKRFRWEIP